MADNWISPDSIEDTGENWISGSLYKVIDGNHNTYGYCDALNPGFWTHAVEMILDVGIQCDKIEIKVNCWDDENEENYNGYVDIEVYWDGAYHDIYEGVISYGVVTEKDIDSGNTHLVTKVKVNCKYVGNDEDQVDVEFWEFRLNQVPSVARPLVGGSLAAGKKGLV